jgi:sulfide:quinone oxidoreductase
MSEGKFRRVAEDFWVAPQLAAGDFAAVRALGVRTVINNRPDGEAADQLPTAQAKAAVEALGLAYAFVPAPSGAVGPDHVRAFRAAVDRGQGPFLAFCRSGTRSCYLWAFSAVRSRPVDEVVAAAAAAGYDLAPARAALERSAAEAAG